MNKPNLTFSAFCANLAYVDIADRINVTIYLPGERDNFGDKGRYFELKDGASARNVAIYGHWYVTSIDFGGSEEHPKFDITLEENPPF